MTKRQQKLIEDNHNLIYSFLGKYYLPIEEFYGVAAIGLCKSALTYKEGGYQFSTYAYTCMLNEIKMSKRKSASKKAIPQSQIMSYEADLMMHDGSTESFLNILPSTESVENSSLSKLMFREYIKKAKDRDKKILILFSGGYKQREICKIVGCSQPEVSRAKKRFEDYLNS